MTRIIVWSVVGLAVLAVIIFVVPQMREQKRLQQGAKLFSTEHIVSDAEAYDKYIARSEREVERYSKKLEVIKTRAVSLTAEQQTMLANLEVKIGEMATAVADLKNKTTREEKDAAVTYVKNIRKEITTKIRDLGGKTTSPSDS